TQRPETIDSARETEHRVERGHQLVHLFEFSGDPTPELVDPGNLPRTLLKSAIDVPERRLEDVRTADEVLDFLDRAPVLLADVPQRLVVTGDGGGQTPKPCDREVERLPDHRRGVVEDLGDFLRAGHSQRQAEQTALTRTPDQALHPTTGLCSPVGRRSQGGHTASSRLCVPTELPAPQEREGPRHPLPQQEQTTREHSQLVQTGAREGTENTGDRIRQPTQRWNEEFHHASHWLQDGVQQPQERRQKLHNHRDHAGQRLSDRTQQRADLRADRLEPLAERLDDLLETRSDSLGDIRQERGQVGESPEQGLEDRGHSIASTAERVKDLTERLLAADGFSPPLERLSNRLDLVQQTARGILGDLEDAADA